MRLIGEEIEEKKLVVGTPKHTGLRSRRDNIEIVKHKCIFCSHRRCFLTPTRFKCSKCQKDVPRPKVGVS